MSKRCTLRTGACPVHGYIHGQEAEELRNKIEKMIEEYASDDGSYLGDVAEDLQYLLDSVDARDSVAFLEANEKPKAKKRKT